MDVAQLKGCPFKDRRAGKLPLARVIHQPHRVERPQEPDGHGGRAAKGAYQTEPGVYPFQTFFSR